MIHVGNWWNMKEIYYKKEVKVVKGIGSKIYNILFEAEDQGDLSKLLWENK